MGRPELILFTPGPVRIPALVAEYLAHPPCNYHRQQAFSEMLSATERDLKHLIGIKDPAAYFATTMTATGTGANEACMQALEPLGKGLVVTNGYFGNRAVDQTRQNGMDVAVLEQPTDRPISPDAVAATLDADPAIKWVFFVSHETRAGLRNPFEDIGAACKARGRYVAVDLISSAYSYPVDIERSQVDFATASSAKAIMGVPGLGIVFVRLASIAPLKAAAARRPRSYYLDVVAETETQSTTHQPRFAQPVALHAALRAACENMNKIGIEAHFARIQRQMKSLIDFLGARGIEPMLDASYRSNIAVNFRLPAPWTYKAFSQRMEGQGYFCLYGIPGDQSHFQLSTIGDLTDEHVAGVQRAIANVLDG